MQVKSKSIQKLLASNAEWKLQSKKLLNLVNKMYENKCAIFPVRCHREDIFKLQKIEKLK